MTAATNQHYDLDPELFARFLDPLRKYSSGLFEADVTTLEQAQRRKLSFVAGQLRLMGGERLLDVGCGWGSLLLFMAKEYGCRVTGISPAANQHEYIASRVSALGLEKLVTTEVASFETYEPQARGYDAVTMLGSVVHIPDLDAVFAKIRRALRPRGRLYLSESCFRNAAIRDGFDERPGTEFVRNSIFGNGELRPLSELVAGAESAGFSVSAVHDLTDDYRRTIDCWIDNLRAQPESPQRADLMHYLEIANAGWGYTTKHYALVCSKTR
ncbi:cyclopropane-fatty-acyl-phospholipid synthase family protein [Amycolatopsis sp. GM8]|uniref:SAM-dependent methyltransferase n=1 Tax=Amycolatopsis sp. GM8 TaxID=2896530 RepID=UPI001F317E1E|nr:class I SAM-dependent methyltransferase [Amycolatopsis sp. GM8]